MIEKSQIKHSVLSVKEVYLRSASVPAVLRSDSPSPAPTSPQPEYSSATSSRWNLSSNARLGGVGGGLLWARQGRSPGLPLARQDSAPVVVAAALRSNCRTYTRE